MIYLMYTFDQELRLIANSSIAIRMQSKMKAQSAANMPNYYVFSRILNQRLNTSILSTYVADS